MTGGRKGLGPVATAGYVVVTWLEYGRVLAGLRTSRLPDLVRRLEGRRRRLRLPRMEPPRLALLVYRALHRGPHRPRCLTTSLVLFRMLARQGTAAQLVIGLPAEPTGHEAHAWVEVDGVEVGPPPGSLGHEPLARFGSGDPGVAP